MLNKLRFEIAAKSAGFISAMLICLFLVCLPGFAQQEQQASQGSVNFSFDQVDIRTFVKLVGDMTGRKFVVADKVTGKITVISPKVQQKDVYQLFVNILESCGCTVVDDQGVFSIVPMPERASSSAPVIGPNEVTPLTGLITKVIKLNNVSASEIRKALEPRVSGGKTGGVTSVDETNHIIITDTAENVRRAEKIIAEIDKPGTARTTEVIRLQFASSENLALELNSAIQQKETKQDKLLNRLPAAEGASSGALKTAIVVPSPHSNSLILVGNQTQIEELKNLISKMDVDTPSGRGNLNAVFLKYISAEEAAKSINSLLGKPDKQTQASQNPMTNRKISIEANAANNALLVDAAPGDFEVVRRLVDQLDQVAQQVHIEVMIMEYNITDDFKFGIEALALDTPSQSKDVVAVGSLTYNDKQTILDGVQNGIFPGGLTIGVAKGTYTDAAGKVHASGFPGVINFDAMKKDGNFRVVSQTGLEAQNNKEASVNIVNQIPILKSTIQGGSGTARDVIQNIERLDVGIKLKLTPRIIPNGEIQVQLSPSIEAVIDQGPSGQYTPTIARREVTTTVTVKDGKTIIIAGLTREDNTEMIKKLPILGYIPIIGQLFTYKARNNEKTNMLIFVTPKSVTDQASVDALRKSWQEKTGLTNTVDAVKK